MPIWSDDAPTESRRNGGGQLLEEETGIREETRGKGKRKEAAASTMLEFKNESRIVYGEAPSRVTERRQSTDDDVGRSKLTRNQIVFATRPTEVVADTKRSIPGGPDPQHHCVNP
ncbi:unnamed protein product [Musa textilis]